MAQFADPQRHNYYQVEAARAGIHAPILQALYQTHQSPQLAEGETGLGIAPANRIAIDQVNTFEQQVRYAANTIRSLTDSLTAQGWGSRDLWNILQGNYSDRFVQAVAEGYVPAQSDPLAARLEATEPEALLTAYKTQAAQALEQLSVDISLSQLEQALLRFVSTLPTRYHRLRFERQALLEMVRIWRKLNNLEAAIATLNVPVQGGIPDVLSLDTALMQFGQQVPTLYSGYPHQREALLRLVQLWYQLNSRTETINQLLAAPETAALPLLDPALIAFAQQVPHRYHGQGAYRLALTETFRLWHQLDSRTAALAKLGVSADYLKLNAEDTEALTQAAVQVDQGLRQFMQQVPQHYQAQAHQREALLQLVQQWRSLDNRNSTVQSVFDDLRQLEAASRATAAPLPPAAFPPPRPERWGTGNLQLAATIIPNGSFTWAEATQGGLHLPQNQAAVESIVQLAHLIQQARDRIGHPFHVVRWYDPSDPPLLASGIVSERHAIGDTVVFYCAELTSNQIYWSLSPWWPGGLCRSSRFPALVQVDMRGYRVRFSV
ncbi:peptidase M15A [Sphaerothrix gracilis]|uniref:peptidase M15A n=1 Tax=Sphaerothrix gracilis TaxID=3151835 RepID=UPI0031FD6FB4